MAQGRQSIGKITFEGERSGEFEVMISERNLSHIVNDHFCKKPAEAERWGLVMYFSGTEDNPFSDVSEIKVKKIREAVYREISQAVSKPRFIAYYDNSQGLRDLRLLISDRCLVVVLQVRSSTRQADVLTAYVPKEAGRHRISDTPDVIDALAHERILNTFVLRYCPLNDTRLPSGAWDKEIYKTALRQWVAHRIAGFVIPSNFGFESNNAGARFIGTLRQPKAENLK